MAKKKHNRYFMLTLGCPKNQVDSEGMSELLADDGFRATQHLERADYLIVNTCGFLEAAKAESIEAADEEVDSRIQEMADSRGQEAAQMRAYLEKNKMIEDIHHELVFKKVMDFLHDNAGKKPAVKSKKKG